MVSDWAARIASMEAVAGVFGVVAGWCSLSPRWCLRLGCAEPVDGRWLGVDCHSDSVGCLFRHGAQPALLACVHVAIDMSCWWHAEVLRIRLIPARLPAMARRIRPRLRDAWMWTSHEGAFLPLLFPVWHMHDNLMWFQGDRCQAYIIATIQWTWSWIIAFTGIIMNGRQSALSSRSVWFIVSDEMEDYGVPKSGIRRLRGYYAFNADNKPGADQSKEDKQGNTKKRQVELESCGNSERRVGGGSPVWCHYSRCQQHHQGAGWRANRTMPSGMPGRVPVPMASSARSVFGGITEPAWKAFSISHNAFPWWCSPEHGSAFSLLLSIHAPFAHAVIVCIWRWPGNHMRRLFCLPWASICHHCRHDEGMVSYGSGGRVMRFKPIMWMIGCPLSKEDRMNTDSRSPWWHVRSASSELIGVRFIVA